MEITSGLSGTVEVCRNDGTNKHWFREPVSWNYWGSWSSTGDTPEQEYRHGPHGGTWSLNGHKTGVVCWVSVAFVKNSPWITYWMMYGSMGKRLYYLHLTWINMNSFTIIWIWPPMQNDVTNDTKNPIKYLAISILIACRYLFLSLYST